MNFSRIGFLSYRCMDVAGEPLAMLKSAPNSFVNYYVRDTVAQTGKWTYEQADMFECISNLKLAKLYGVFEFLSALYKGIEKN